MFFKDLALCFNQSLQNAFSRKKFLFVFPVLVLCGVFIVFCKALALKASFWVSMSMVFLPIFFSSGILLSVGVILIRIYYHEKKSLKWRISEIVSRSLKLIIGTLYLSIPAIMIYLLLWVILGIFLLMQDIPYIGPFIGIVLSFAPFLIIFSSLVLVVINLAFLFFISPFIALKSKGKIEFAKEFFLRFRENIFSHLLFFFVAFFPIILIVILLSLAAILTNLQTITLSQSLYVALQWFFIMLPFCALVTPVVVFFFNFAAETYHLFYEEGESSV